MESPRPLPSVVLDSSPRINRSVSSSALMFSGASEIFFIVKSLTEAMKGKFEIYLDGDLFKVIVEFPICE